MTQGRGPTGKTFRMTLRALADASAGGKIIYVVPTRSAADIAAQYIHHFASVISGVKHMKYTVEFGTVGGRVVIVTDSELKQYIKGLADHYIVYDSYGRRCNSIGRVADL